MRLTNLALYTSISFAIIAPSHAANFVTIREGAYGYIGWPIAHKPGELPPPVALIFVRFLGSHNGEYSFEWNNGAGNLIIEACHRPCEAVVESQFTGAKLDHTAPNHFDPHTGLGQAIQDAMANQLKPFPIPGLDASIFGITMPKSLAAGSATRVQTDAKIATAKPPLKTPSGIQIEHDAVLFRSDQDSLILIDQLVRIVRANNFSCDSVSAADPMVFENGYELTCNKFAYSYDIQDKGGHWMVTVE